MDHLTEPQRLLYHSQLRAHGGRCRCGQCTWARAQLIARGDLTPPEGGDEGMSGPSAEGPWPLPTRTHPVLERDAEDDYTEGE